MKGLQPLSYILVKTLIGDDGYYKIDRQDGGPPIIPNDGPVGSYRIRKKLKGLDTLLDLEIAKIVIYDSKKKYLGFIIWNNWNEGDERVNDYSIWFDEHWGKFGATAQSPFKSIDELCGDWHDRWEQL